MHYGRSLFTLCMAAALAACGGGGDSGGGGNDIALQGTWIYSSDAHNTGSLCGLDAQGNYGERQTFIFSANTYTFTREGCLILQQGNTGGYLESDRASGTYATGGVYVSSNDPTAVMTALDFQGLNVPYTSFNISNNVLKIAYPFSTHTGKTPDTRAFQTASFYDPIQKTVIRVPSFNKY